MKGNQVSQKLKRIFTSLKGAQTILLLNTNYRDPNFLYVTGFKSGIFEMTFTIINRGKVEVLANELEYATGKSQETRNLKVLKISSSKQQRARLQSAIAKKSIALNEPFIPYTYWAAIKKRYKPTSILDASQAFEEARLIKDDYEIGCISRAVSITKRAQEQIRKHCRIGMSEKELADIFDDISSKLGSHGPSFETIVCFGKNAAYPHHFPSDARLKRGDFVLIDAGAKFNNYCSDITRTFIFEGDSHNAKSKEKMDMYNTVKEAQQLAIGAIKPGVKGKDIHKIAADHIDGAFGGRYKGKFIHSLGHSVGIEVHDGAGFSPGAEQEIKPGMVITVEPGIYIEGFGGVRIEDDILVTRKGHKVL